MQSSKGDIEIIINGHRFEGYAEEDEPYDLTFPETSAQKFGPHGNVYSDENRRRDAVLTLRLAPHSPSTQWCI